MEGNWQFVPYEKKHDGKTGYGYFIKNIDDEWDFIEYEREFTDDGYWVTHLDGTKVFTPNPVEEPEEEEFDEDAA